MRINPILLKDFYKVGHIDQYPKGTNLVFSNFTPRKSKLKNVNGSVFFGLRYFIKHYLQNEFNDLFFHSSHSQAELYAIIMEKTLGNFNYPKHIKQLSELGYLPLEIRAIEELTFVPSGVPALTLWNTHPDFFWLPGMIETLLSCTLWSACTSATIAREYRKILDEYANQTSDIPEFVDYQAHDFSTRGMSSIETACISGTAHLKYFKGTDCIPAILFNSQYYGALHEIASIPATEHSVMSAGGKEDEFETFRRIITETYPTGFVSIVSDTWDLWRVVGEYLPILKTDILSRNGRVVIRPDSGNPIDIICGIDVDIWKNAEGRINAIPGLPEKGLIECLWDIFGGTVNDKGYKQLDSRIGAIYGDGINLDNCRVILEKLKLKGFASTNIVFGVGSYSYQFVTRDTLGWAMKSTYCEVNNIGRNITKDPVTDDGTKKSASGLLKVIKDENGELKLLQNQSWHDVNASDNELKVVFRNGELM